MMKREKIHHLKLENVSLKSESGKSIFDRMNYEVPLHKIFWVRGPTSAGKTVFIRMLGGLIMPDEGSYFINGENIMDLTFEEFQKYRLNIGYSFDFGGLINNRTLFQNLSLPLEYHRAGTPDEIEIQVQKYMKIFGLEEVAHERPSSVAGGYRKAICVARAFMLDPEVLLLDDPTTGLRGASRENLKELILQNHKNGISKHIYIATEDEAFMRSLQADIIEVENMQVKSKQLEAA